ncbi:MAG TPA: efflux transporter outer membrane subunit [Steroidobacteraceae bacterium]|nr:efflux transporter outer membrane subunit [Steroidobacteraceae bacterium]
MAALMLAGCAVGPDFHRPIAPAADRYLPEAPPSSAPARAPAQAPSGTPPRLVPGAALPGEWWGLFHSAPLEEAVQAALAGSPTLAAATATLAEAEQQVAAARGAFWPRISANAGAQHTTSTGGGAGGGTGGSGAPLQPSPNVYSLGLSASYALDVFGGTRRTVEQQGALAEMQRYQQAAAYLTLTGNVVSEALTIASTRLQIATTEELIASDRKNLALTEREFEVGTAARSDVLTADSQLASDLTQLPTLRQQLDAAKDALAVLTGHAPGQWRSHDFDITEFTLPEEIPLALPAQLVRQRPDVLAAEAQLHATSAAIGVALAQEFPSLTLSGALTRSALEPGALFHDFDTLREAAGAVAAPLFAGGALRAQTEAARDAFRAQAATYEGVVVTALGQVTDDLWALQNDAERMVVYQHSVDIASEALKLQQASYTVGKSSVLQLIDAQRTYAQARLGLATALVEQYQDAAGLLVALGGAWWKVPLPK